MNSFQSIQSLQDFFANNLTQPRGNRAEWDDKWVCHRNVNGASDRILRVCSSFWNVNEKDITGRSVYTHPKCLFYFLETIEKKECKKRIIKDDWEGKGKNAEVT